MARSNELGSPGRGQGSHPSVWTIGVQRRGAGSAITPWLGAEEGESLGLVPVGMLRMGSGLGHWEISLLSCPCLHW